MKMSKKNKIKFVMTVTLSMIHIILNTDDEKQFETALNKLTSNKNNLISNYNYFLGDLLIKHENTKKHFIYKNNYSSQLLFFQKIEDYLNYKYENYLNKIESFFDSIYEDDENYNNYKIYANFLDSKTN